MKSYQLFEHMSPVIAHEILGYVQQERTSDYKELVAGLAQQRKLRPVFVERKPLAERYAWLQAALSRKVSDTFAAHFLQAWLLGANRSLLCDFLDALGIAHDPDGTVATLPESPEKEKLHEVITGLLDKYPAEKIAIYLHAFHDMDTTVSWPPLGEVLAEDERLKLGAG